MACLWVLLHAHAGEVPCAGREQDSQTLFTPWLSTCGCLHSKHVVRLWAGSMAGSNHLIGTHDPDEAQQHLRLHPTFPNAHCALAYAHAREILHLPEQQDAPLPSLYCLLGPCAWSGRWQLLPSLGLCHLNLAGISAGMAAGDVQSLLETYDRERRVLPAPVLPWKWGWTRSAEIVNGR